jgi:hypothetical protein
MLDENGPNLISPNVQSISGRSQSQYYGCNQEQRDIRRLQGKIICRCGLLLLLAQTYLRQRQHRLEPHPQAIAVEHGDQILAELESRRLQSIKYVSVNNVTQT